MEAFDEKLAEIFKQKKMEKQDKKSKWTFWHHPIAQV
jgi:hypothetical protein